MGVGEKRADRPTFIQTNRCPGRKGNGYLNMIRRKVPDTRRLRTLSCPLTFQTTERISIMSIELNPKQKNG